MPARRHPTNPAGVTDAELAAERWAPALDGAFLVSDMGRILHRNTATGRYGRPTFGATRGDGYLYVIHAGRQFKIHRLVLLAFVGEPPSARAQGAHADGARGNNRLGNLRWASAMENHADKVRHRRTGRKLTDDAIALMGVVPDAHIASACGVSRAAVHLWRKRHPVTLRPRLHAKPQPVDGPHDRPRDARHQQGRAPEAGDDARPLADAQVQGVPSLPHLRVLPPPHRWTSPAAGKTGDLRSLHLPLSLSPGPWLRPSRRQHSAAPGRGLLSHPRFGAFPRSHRA